MSMMESPLEVLSRAATMVQDNANEARLTTKELPTTKWRRDRRLRTSEYHHSHSSSSSISPSSPQQLPHVPPPLHQQSSQNLSSSSNCSNTNGTAVRSLNETTETPLDMSVTSANVKPRSPPPPYREPLPGSTFATALARPSVITQAPPKRESLRIQNQNAMLERESDNSSSAESDSVCDPVIDEHFRRSLGADYMSLFKKKSSPPLSGSPPQQQQPTKQQDTDEEENHSPKHRTTVTVNGESVGMSVDDHFAKALGDTWKKLQADKAKNDE